MTPALPSGRPPAARALLALLVTLATVLCLLPLSLLGCAGESPATCGAPGVASSCPCAGGGSGVQECGPWGAWTACVCGGDGGSDVTGDVGDVLEDAVAVGDAADASDAAEDALGDAPARDAPADSSADAAAVDAADSSADVPDGPPPPSVDLTLSSAEVWQSIDGAPPRLVGTACGVTGSQLSYRAPAMRGTYNLVTRASSTSAGCDGMAGDFRPPDVTHMVRGPYGPPGSSGMQRVNLRVAGSLGPPACERVTRVEVWALGCAVAP